MRVGVGWGMGTEWFLGRERTAEFCNERRRRGPVTGSARVHSAADEASRVDDAGAELPAPRRGNA